MKAIRMCIVGSALAMLAGGCGWEVSMSGGSTSVSRSNDELTVKIDAGPITEGSGKTAEEKRGATSFRKVTAQHGIQVAIDVGGANALTVEADDNLLPLIETKVEGETLEVRVAGNLRTRNPIRVTANTSQLSDASAASSASITANKLSGSSLHVEATSSGEVSIDEVSGDQIELAANSSGRVTTNKVEAKKLLVIVSSSGKVTAAGNVDEQRVEVSSSGTYDGANLASRSAEIDCSSSGSAVVQATEEIAGTASSSGTIRYSGDPPKVTVQTISSGSVVKM